MTKYLYLLAILVFFSNSTKVRAQGPLLKNYDSGMIHYLNGRTLEGQIAFGTTYIRYKSDNGETKKKVSINSVKKIDIYKKKDTVSYGYFFDEKTYKSKIDRKKKKKMLGRIIYDYEHVKVYGVKGKGLDLGIVDVGAEYLFLKRGKGGFGRPLQKPLTSRTKLLKEALSNCKDLLPEIGKKYKFNSVKQLQPILEYYNENCGVRRRKARS